MSDVRPPEGVPSCVGHTAVRQDGGCLMSDVRPPEGARAAFRRTEVDL